MPVMENSTSNIYSCFKKPTTEKCNHKASKPEKKLLKI